MFAFDARMCICVCVEVVWWKGGGSLQVRSSRLHYTIAAAHAEEAMVRDDSTGGGEEAVLTDSTTGEGRRFTQNSCRQIFYGAV